ncbi:TetR/AcrR family transcriptional regulator [Planomonospora venezuelensis]|uniref:AcrR family transcriptional regulator n=1 Tax=Planomonospora venezuelensis TaxID=1999 RepID=A0A841D6Z0_PLAVE|nr:TetR/AcrR family transcriptional regulator [Planomonospora venezuelensis]MBB5966001.1 AcrR family transcriptional regulator [Planomonospora venezuelensis]GIN02345.1 TetR family transcriptional regulator [Planomonospora venezuelensis]
MNRPDRRARRTRRAVQDALVELILDKGYGAVTVTDLVDRADIGRSTFYSHFSGRQDVLFSNIDEVADLLRPGRGDGTGPALSFALPLLEHIDENRHLVRALTGPGSDTAVQDRIRRVLSSIIRAELLTARPAGARPSADLDVVVACAVGAFMALVSRWTDGDTAETPAQLEAVFRRMLSAAHADLPGDPPGPAGRRTGGQDPPATSGDAGPGRAMPSGRMRS